MQSLARPKLNSAYFLLMLCLGTPSMEKSFDDEKSISSEDLLSKTLSALERAVAFYSKDYDKVNLDSIFGLRMCQGVLHESLEQSGTIRTVNERQVERVKILHSTISRIADSGYQSLALAKTDYFHRFKVMVQDEWFFMMRYQPLEHSLILQSDGSFADDLDESLSDQCMTDIVGNQDGGSSKLPCVVTDNCWKTMTEKFKGGYHLTHQALFMMLAEKHGCRSKIVEKLGSHEDWNVHMRSLGSNIYYQMEKMYTGDLKSNNVDKDLFAEQIVVCQMLGILECFDSKYLDLLLKWQDASGCWKDNNHDEERRDVEDVEYTGGEFLEDDNGQKLRRISSRKLTAEKILSGGCASHFTGVATGVLGMYTYWFLHPPGNQSFASSHGVFDSTSIKFSFGRIPFDLTWPVVFIIVTLFAYYCRKWMRNRCSRTHTKLTI